jgi:lipoprotein-anchoring transpeptidase ErfK/SrfK
MSLRIRIAITALFCILFFSNISLAQQIQEEFLIDIKLSEFKLTLIDKNSQSSEFKIATPAVTPKSLPIEAIVLAVERDPYWHPTERTREAYLRQRNIELPILLRPGDPRNAMGKGLIRLKYSRSGLIDGNVVIHGTNDEESIGKKISRGCIRLYNKDIITIIQTIQNKSTRVIFQK